MSICFATAGVYPILKAVGAYGGSELRAWRLARYLARRPGFTVSMLAYDYGQPRSEVIEGVRFLRDSACVFERSLVGRLRWRLLQAVRRGRIEGVPLLLEPDYHIWDQADADIYLAFGATNYSARLARWCAVRNKPFILMQGGDMDLAPKEPFAERVYGLPGLSVAQTPFQQEELLKRFHRSSEVLQNPIAIPAGGPYLEPRKFALWVGKSDRIKCPERMVDLARLSPDVPVVMVMNRADGMVFDAVKAQAPANVSFVDAVAPEEMQTYYRDACVLVSTSITEGFPNSFLEAGANGTPILSLDVDPAGMLTDHGAGVVTGGSLERASGLLQQLWAERGWEPGCSARVMGERGFRYVEERHAQDRVFERFERILLSFSNRSG
ncbi:glycosyltransferase family 4 protein [Agrobacterium sp. RAC06]|uniref:glycosyltransferase family 4 protein n=1 Tax=Agrobacterium sp. RAC06 TaxID=1842536 RepID=UPI000856B3C2|nr:glycosyltransferase family 4 protein [Agrobacterium sp. RAC06]AOG12780.1 glycosyl transferases group 1 family protein [Agrobacterium sp. RAC06]